MKEGDSDVYSAQMMTEEVRRMKRMAAWLSSVLLLLFFFPAALSESPAVLLDFEDGQKVGISRYGSCRYDVVEDTDIGFVLKVYERTDLSGVEIRSGKLGFRKGDTVCLSFRVRQDSGRVGTVTVSSAAENAPVFLKEEIPSGIWTSLECVFISDDGGNLRFGTDATLTGEDFSLDDIRVEVTDAADPIEGKRFGNWPVTGELPSLKEHYKDHFLFGGAMAGTELQEPGRQVFCRDQYAILTLGNELKPDSVFDKEASRTLVRETGDETAVAVHLTAAKPFLDYCSKYGIAVHGHTLLWHNQTPADFFHIGYDCANELAGREIMLGRMENYIREVMEITEQNYPGLIVSWDVVNEAIDDGTGKPRTQVLWYKTVGPDYISQAFAFARKYARPDVLLCYNDYSTPYSPKLSGIVELLTQLVAEGNIDCYGFQAHYESGQPGIGMIELAIQKISGLGLKLRVSEMDIKIRSTTPAALQAQAVRYKELMDLFVRYDRYFVAVQIWGTTDDTSWLASDHPLPFSHEGKPKPAFWAMVGGEPAAE